ncbi:hypothetical protein KC336_g20376, partial [Hortaea werneckii]
KPGQNSRIGDTERVADDIEDGEGLGEANLGSELGQADETDDEDLSRQGNGVLQRGHALETPAMFPVEGILLRVLSMW